MALSTKPSLTALTAAALALPGLAAAQLQTDYQFARYTEGDLRGSRSVDGVGGSRFEIDTHLFRVAAPMSDQTVVGTLKYETLSGASPWWVQPDEQGRPVQVMSRASIHEERFDGQATWVVPFKGVNWGLSAGYSTENDYRATSAGLEFEYTPSGASYSISGGVGYSYDRLNPTVGASSLDVIAKADKDSFSAYGGVSWILSARTVVQTALNFGLDQGYLSDPYKRAWIVDEANTVRDRRPDERHQGSVSVRLRHSLTEQRAALHADYRYYRDDWSIEAHTVELSWHQRLGEGWRLTPGVRWYSQAQADFYAPFYQSERDDGLASSDYRLAPYGAISVRADLRKALPDDWIVGGGVEWYEASGDYALGSVKIENPGLVDYLILSLRLGKRF